MLVHLSSFDTASEGRKSHTKCTNVYRTLLPLTSMCHIMPIFSLSLSASLLRLRTFSHRIVIACHRCDCVWNDASKWVENAMRSKNGDSILLIAIDVFTMPSDTILPFINDTDFCVCVLIFCWRSANGQNRNIDTKYNKRSRFRALNLLNRKKNELKMPRERHNRSEQFLFFASFAVKTFFSLNFFFGWKNERFYQSFRQKRYESNDLSKYLIAYQLSKSFASIHSRPTQLYSASMCDRRSGFETRTMRKSEQSKIGRIVHRSSSNQNTIFILTCIADKRLLINERRVHSIREHRE